MAPPKPSEPQKDSDERTILFLLKKPVKHLREHTKRGGQNSNYKGRAIKLRDVHIWEDFITVAEVESLWNDSTEMKAAVERTLKPKESGRCVWEEPEPSDGMLNEMCLEREWASVHKQLNLAAEICAKAEQHTENPVYLKMGNGQNATWLSPNAEDGAQGKKPDYAGYLYTDESQYSEDAAKQVFNRIPGDAKLYRKIHHAMLPPKGIKFRPGKANFEAQKVLNQIHGYMDQHEARYGYIVNNEELIFFRRRDSGWGQLDVSPPIRHDVEADAETGVLNSKYVLFYFHWKVARDDDPSAGWRLKSFGKDPDPTSTSPTATIENTIGKKKQLLKRAQASKESNTSQKLQSKLYLRIMMGWKEMGFLG